MPRPIPQFEKRTDELKDQIHGLFEGQPFGVVFAALLEVTHETIHLAIEEDVESAEAIHDLWMDFVHEVADVL